MLASARDLLDHPRKADRINLVAAERLRQQQPEHPDLVEGVHQLRGQPPVLLDLRPKRLDARA